MLRGLGQGKDDKILAPAVQSIPVDEAHSCPQVRYDVRNKMTSASVNGTTGTYVYDDAGNRVEETIGTAATYYLTDTQNPTGYAQPIETHTATPGSLPTVTYIIGDRVFAQYNGGTPTIKYLIADGHGSTRQFVNSSGDVTRTFDYDAFGTPLTSTTNMTVTPFLFGGDAVYDSATGFYMHGDGVRDRQGFRFIQMDSYMGQAGDPMSLHKYLFADADADESMGRKRAFFDS